MINSPETPEVEKSVLLNVRLPESLKSAARAYIRYSGISMHDFVTEAIAEKLSANSIIMGEILLERKVEIDQRLAEVASILELLDGITSEYSFKASEE